MADQVYTGLHNVKILYILKYTIQYIQMATNAHERANQANRTTAGKTGTGEVRRL